MEFKKRIFVTKGPDPYVFLRAKAFRDVALQIEGQYHEAHVVAMNLAFACELFLKCLWVTRRDVLTFEVMEDGTERQVGDGETSYESIRVHDLSIIFEELPPQTRASLGQRFRDEHEGELLNLIDACKSLFVDLRYFHEKQSMSYQMDALLHLSEFLAIATDEEIQRGVNNLTIEPA